VYWRSIPLQHQGPKKIVKLNNICLNNVVTQYGDQLYTQENGIVNSDNHFVSLANSAVHYILRPIAGALREAERFRRFMWFGTNVSPSLHIR